jgi:hypothetical protein
MVRPTARQTQRRMPQRTRWQDRRLTGRVREIIPGADVLDRFDE